jgi:hypothetical protein
VGEVKPLKLDEVRFEYLKIKPPGFGVLDDEWRMIADPSGGGGRLADRTTLASCVRCGRLMEDPTRDVFGQPMPEHLFDSEEEKDAVCSDCLGKAVGEALEEDLLLLLEDKLGLAERHREALKSFIETIFTDPQKILQVKDLDNRVRELEKQNGRLWLALGIEGGLLAVLIASVVAIALALAS